LFSLHFKTAFWGITITSFCTIGKRIIPLLPLLKSPCGLLKSALNSVVPVLDWPIRS
jgi:hypothetical protein